MVRLGLAKRGITNKQAGVMCMGGITGQCNLTKLHALIEQQLFLEHQLINNTAQESEDTSEGSS